MNPGLKNRLIKFSWNALEDPDDISSLAHLAIGVLFEEGYTEKEIRERFNQPDRRWTDVYGDEEPYTIPGYAIKDAVFDRVEVWRNEYPYWPINEDPNSNEDSHRNQKGQGHEKQNGRGHR